MKPIKSQHSTPITHHPSGISLIALIITIIVIIILAAIVIFSGLNTPDRANLAKFTQSISDFRTAIQQDYMQKKLEYATSGKTRSEAQIYYIIASGADTIEDINEEPADGSSQYSGTEIVSLEDLGVADKNIEGTYAYQITSDTNVANWKTNSKYYEPTETHWVTDKGDVFVLPGYRTEENGQEKYYLNERTQLAEAVSSEVVVWGGQDDIASPEFKEENGIWNWYIYTPAQLKFLADFVNNGNSLTGTANGNLADLVDTTKYDLDDITITSDTTVKLMKNLDMGGRIGTEGATEAEKWESNTANAAVAWTPIGVDNSTKMFKGTFEGNNHTIRGVYVNREESYNGLFGNSNTIKNMTIKDSCIQGMSETGGIVGDCYGTIENCHNINTTVILLEEQYLYNGGGIVAMMYGTNTIINCSNSGKILGEKGINVGGIVGYIPSTVIITGCNNKAEVNGKKQVGGIVGMSLGTLTYCNNYGRVEASSEVGGIIGWNRSTYEVSNCINNGNVNGNTATGGIAGNSFTSTKISNCTNIGAIKGGGITGGIVGDSGGTISDCTNTGAVKGTAYVGGIVGYTGGNAISVVTRCSNIGSVEGTRGAAGGVIGTCESSKGQDISLCYNSGAVKAATNAGGISGYLGAKGANPVAKEDKCYNKGTVTSTTDSSLAGGIVGRMASDAKVTNCYYLSSIGVVQGIGDVNNGGENYTVATEAQNAGAQPTTQNINSFEEFLTWIENPTN